MSHHERIHRQAESAVVPQGGAVGGKTARACDACIRRRALWFCPADDAFLCNNCDSYVHFANPLACRHQRVRLKTASSSSSSSSSTSSLSCSDELPIPAWLKGFTRKARTPRAHHHNHQHHAKAAAQLAVPSRAQQWPPSSTTVPDLMETIFDENEEEQLLYRVPIFDPVLSEFSSPPPSFDDSNASSGDDAKMFATMDLSDAALAASSTFSIDAGNRELADLFTSDMELAEFAANMESLLGDGADGADGSFFMEKFGLVEPNDGNDGGKNCCLEMAAAGHVKAEQQLGFDDVDDKDNCQGELEIEVSKETLELNFDWTPSPMTGEDQEEVYEEKASVGASQLAEQGANKKAKLKLDYEAIVNAWTTSRGSSPWTDGKRPQISLDSCWPADYMIGLYGGMGGGKMPGAVHGGEMAGAVTPGDDGGREARVTRYREKRRTRLFSKKIRYEVRKLNAEKRPRMKGRFVKRTPGMAIAHSSTTGKQL